MKVFLGTTLVLFLALTHRAMGQCDPPDTIEEIDETCPSEEEAQDTAVTFPDPDHCSQYWECWNGCASHQLCDNDYLYDDYYEYCNFPEEVICGDRDCDDRDCLVPEEVDEDFQCEDPEGLYEYPDNCIKYVQCHSNVAMVNTCEVQDGVQLLWCPECGDDEGWCDFPENVDCGDRPICDENDENCSDTPAGSCDDVACENDGYVEEGPCEECVCECDGGVAEELCCSDGLFWNPDENGCTSPDDNPAC